MSRSVKWGILGAGGIARAFVAGVESVDTAEVVAVGSRSADKAEQFIAENGIKNATGHGSYESLLADPKVDAVYIATPHPMHAAWSIRAAEAGKHVLCEKPAAMNEPETMAVLEAVRSAGVFYMEAFKDRCHPQLAEILKIIASGAIGEVRVIEATFGFSFGGPIKPESRVFDPQLGGGGILDVGCYGVEWVRRVAGAAVGKTFADPVEVTGSATRRRNRRRRMGRRNPAVC